MLNNKQVEEITSGAILGQVMSTSLSIDVAMSIDCLWWVPTSTSIFWLLIPGYLAAIIMSFFTPKIFTAIFLTWRRSLRPQTATFLLPSPWEPAAPSAEASSPTLRRGWPMVAMTPLITIQMLGLLYQYPPEEEWHQRRADAPADDDIIEPLRACRPHDARRSDRYERIGSYHHHH